MIRIILLVIALLCVNKLAHAQSSLCCNGGTCYSCPTTSTITTGTTCCSTGNGCYPCSYTPPPRYSDLIVTGKAGLLRYQSIKEDDCKKAADALRQSSDVTDAKCLDRVKQ